MPEPSQRKKEKGVAVLVLKHPLIEVETKRRLGGKTQISKEARKGIYHHRFPKRERLVAEKKKRGGGVGGRKRTAEKRRTFRRERATFINPTFYKSGP